MCIKVLALSFPYSLLLKEISGFFFYKGQFFNRIYATKIKKKSGSGGKTQKTEILNPNSNVFPPIWI